MTDIQDRDRGALVLRNLFGKFPFLQKLFADGGYQGPTFCEAQKKVLPCLVTEIVKRSDPAKGFEVLPMARSVSKIGQGLGVLEPEGAHISAHRLHPAHAQKAIQRNVFVPTLSMLARDLFEQRLSNAQTVKAFEKSRSRTSQLI
jgi:hypothetical protein